MLVSSRDDVRRLVKFGAVGASGIPVDFAIVAGCLAVDVHYLLANALGWIVAVTWNFGLNYAWTWERPAGSLTRMYALYLGADVVLFGGRAGVVVGLVELLNVPVLVATGVGIAVVAAATYLFADSVVFTEVADGSE